MGVEFLSLADCRLAYQREVGDSEKPGIIFLGGYASDMTGTKADFLALYCAKRAIPFIRFDYRGCGRSSGTFKDGTIGDWLQDSLAIFDQQTQGPQIVVGSSMGGWLGLLLTQVRAQRIKAFIGVAAAPDFTEELVWKKLTKDQRDTLLRNGEIYDEAAPPDHRVPMTLKLINEARDHLVFKNAFPVTCPVRLLQGRKDMEVPWQYAERIISHLKGDARVTFVEDGDHRLSSPKALETLGQMIADYL